MSTLSNIWNWFKKNFLTAVESADAVAITVTEEAKTLLANGTGDFVAGLIDSVTKTGIAEEVVTILKKEIPNILVVELAIQGLPANPTPEQVLAFEQSILSAFGVLNNKSKLYTTLAAQVYGIIQSTVNTTPGNFADWVIAVENAYQDYTNDNSAN